MTIKVHNHSTRTTAIRNFTKARYVEPSYMAREREAIWRDSWLVAGLESDVLTSGDFFVFDLGWDQILITRTSQGMVQGFHNVCQHRGNRLVSEERGHASSFRCSYHAWTYGIDGDLAIVPFEERFVGGSPCAERGLKKVHTACWNGFVFVHLGAEPEPLEVFLGPVAEMLEPYRFGSMTLVQDQTVRLDCNWKAVVDNFSELYHVDFLHPQHKRMVDCCNDTVHLFERGHTGLAVPGGTVNPRFPIPELPTDIQSAQLKSVGLDPEDFRGRVLDVREALQVQKRKVGQSRGMDYSGFDDEQLSDVWQYNLFPNAILSFTPEHCWLLRPRSHPVDPNRCWFDKMSLVMFADPDLVDGHDLIVPSTRHNTTAYRPDDYLRPARDEFHYDAVLSGDKTLTDTIDQDVELLAGVQRGMLSAGFDSVFLNEDELRVQHFHDRLDQLIG